jgi:radical SAM superfamily enzyme YgiQ (UPF0313 family)
MIQGYDMPLFRPPSEGDNLIVQATLGCSFNQCSFCSMYKSKRFVARPLEQVFAHIDALARMDPTAHRVFLADGDALALPTEALEAIAAKLAATFPGLQRISAYATPGNLLRKTPDELARLKAAKLSLVYLGVESGSREVLRRISKGATADGMVEALDKARSAGIKVSATVILGLGGKRLAEEHAEATAALINRAPPTYLSTLQLTLMEDAAPNFLARWEGGFVPQDDTGVLIEQRRLLAALDPPHPVIFRSNHASNCLPLAGTLPRDKARLLAQVDGALAGTNALRPEWLRGL